MACCHNDVLRCVSVIFKRESFGGNLPLDEW